MERHSPKITKSILKKMNKVGGLTLSDIMAYQVAIVIKAM